MATRGSVPPSDEARFHHMSQLEQSGGAESTWDRWVTFASVTLVLLDRARHRRAVRRDGALGRGSARRHLGANHD